MMKRYDSNIRIVFNLNKRTYTREIERDDTEIAMRGKKEETYYE